MTVWHDVAVLQELSNYLLQQIVNLRYTDADTRFTDAHTYRQRAGRRLLCECGLGQWVR